MIKKPLRLDVELGVPEDGIGWLARVEILDSYTGRVGVAESHDAGVAFSRALLIAFSSSDLEESRVS